MEHCAICTDLDEFYIKCGGVAAAIVGVRCQDPVPAQNPCNISSHGVPHSLEAAESFAAGAVLPLLIICGIIVVLFITSLLASAIVGISILFILPVNMKNDPFICDGLVSVP
jgi:hypothetical protein